MENLLVPYQATVELPCTRMLVLAPHPDDEVFGCGGAIMRHVEQGKPICVIIVSDGAYGVSAEKVTDYISQRQSESIAAAKVLGYDTPIFWNYRDRNISYGEELVQRILVAISETAADLVYAPSVFEMHPDHRALGMATVEAVRRLGKGMHLALYEVGIPLPPNQLLDISDLVTRKMKAMECFVSQNIKQRYDLNIAALNRYRTYTLPAEVTSAEAYILVSAEELAKDPFKLYQSEYSRQKALGLVLNSCDTPLVSVIIRSMDRSTLSDALDSVALQTHANIEVIVVNAKGSTHCNLGEWCGHFPLRLIQGEEQLGRSKAANIGMNAAKGKYIIFLDDDDLFYSEHITNLVAALQKHQHTRCAYAGIRIEHYTDGQFDTVKELNEPFDKHRLWGGNFIPMHAMLFERSLVTDGCYFDENLEVFEDWDLWFQLAQRAEISHIDKISAVYRNYGHSGMGLKHDKAALRKSRGKFYDKWRALLTGEQLDDLVQYQNKVLANLHDQLANSLVREKSLHKTIDDLVHSTSWKITGPLRFFARIIRGQRHEHSFRLLSNRYNAFIKIFKLLTHGGLAGFKRLVTRAFLIFRHEGVNGLKNKLKHFSQGNTVNNNSSYKEWVLRYDTLTYEVRNAMCKHVDSFHDKPLISIVMPTYNSNPEWLKEAIESVRKQIYPNWELCIADDASTDNTTRPILEYYGNVDKRIKVIYRTQNGHISAASNSALEIALGEWVALLDHDDLLSEHALFWVMNAIDRNPGARLIYSDEDKIDTTGKRVDPYFKCDWNRELFYSQNMISHLGVYQTKLLKKIKGFRVGYEGSQDYDLALRYIEVIQTKQIHHIPRVLYHWRTHAESTAQSANAKPYAMLAGEKALNDHFKRQGISADAELIGYGFRVRYALPRLLPKVSLIIPTRNGLQILRQCIESILKKTTYKNFEILIIDNGSDDTETLKYLDVLNSNKKARVLRDDSPFNYSALNNKAVKLAKGKLIGLLNNDLEVISPEWLSEMVSIALQPGVGAVGARLWYPNDTLQHGGVILGLGGIAGHAHKNLPRYQNGYFLRANIMQNFSAVTAACLMIQKTIYEEVGGLNEQDLQVAFNDVDFCLRVQEAGYRNIWTPYAELYHHESATRGDEDTPEKKARFAKEIQYMKSYWGDLLLNDPAYSPNLALDHRNFSFAWPPRTKDFAEQKEISNTDYTRG